MILGPATPRTLGARPPLQPTARPQAPALPTPAARLDDPPPPTRELRAAWIASVANIDWPSKSGLTSAQQQDELRAMLDKAKATGLNAVVLQVRPAGDAFYDSPFEPWSEYLTGKQGQRPEPFYDPLAFAVKEAHARGIELHAWFNPFRARMLNASGQPYGPTAPNHVSQTHPEWVKTYGRNQWLDPGEPGARDFAIQVIKDVVKRYDIDAVHLDDYFYPYPVNAANEPLDAVPPMGNGDEPAPTPVLGAPKPFPDDASYKKYQAAGGKLGRADWRRDNVNQFVERLYREVHETKQHVQVGISPFGIWKPGNPPGIIGMDPTEELFADPKLWLQKGWLDYIAPQLYWPLESVGQSYKVLLNWWASVNDKGRNLFAGMYTSRVADGTGNAWKPTQITRQIDATRQQPGAGGHLHFSMKAIIRNAGGLADMLKDTYQKPALPPATPWLDNVPPPAPAIAVATNARTGERTATWETPAGGEDARKWAVYQRRAGEWQMTVQDASTRSLTLTPDVDALAISAIDSSGNEGPRSRPTEVNGPARRP